MDVVDISKLHGLVVDDEAFMRDLIVRLLKQIGAGQVSSAVDGNAALTALEKAQPKVDVIILDLEMPRLDGHGFIKKLHDELLPPLSETPVIIVSGHSEKEALDRVQKLGVSLFLLKPITPDQLETRIKAALRHKFE